MKKQEIEKITASVNTKFCNYRIVTTAGNADFLGVYCPELEKENWHYYRSKDGSLLHFRKEHMIYVQSWPEVNK